MILKMHLVDPIAHPLDLSVQAPLPQGRSLKRVVSEDQSVQGFPFLRVTVGFFLELGTRGVKTEPRGRLVGRALVLTSYVLLL
jgi:hypothetical protein